MKCDYCHKTVRGDMPDHLEKNPNCSKKHREFLRDHINSQLKRVVRDNVHTQKD
jgi:hypothetical protein